MTSRAAELHLWQGQPRDYWRSPTGSRCYVGYVPCKLISCNSFIWFGSITFLYIIIICCKALSHPVPRKKERSLHMCAQDVHITRTTNNMVNRYNISLNYKLESLRNHPWVQKKHYRVARKSKRRCVFHRHNRSRGRPSLYLLAPAGTLGFDSNIWFDLKQL
jgi:hypothetical protein